MPELKDIKAALDRIALGDQAAFDRLYKATSAKLFGVCLHIVSERADAEDALQNVYVKVWRNAHRYQVNGLSPMTWLITIARNTAVDKLRSRKEAKGAGDKADIADLPDRALGPEAQAAASAQRTQIAACLTELPDDHAVAIRRAYLYGETYQDLSQRFDQPLNSIQTWLRRGLMTLRECLTR